MIKKLNIENLDFALNRAFNLKNIANYWSKVAFEVELTTVFVKELATFDNVFEKFLNEWNIIHDGNNAKKELSELKEVIVKGEIKGYTDSPNNSSKNFNKSVKKVLGVKEGSFDLNKNKLNISLSNRNAYIPLVSNLMSELRQSFLENRVRRYVYKHRLRLDWLTRTPRKWRSPVMFYKRKRRYIRKRFRKFNRFKSVHWYFPAYIYFDSRTLRAVFLRSPKPEEIKFSFKCSLPHVHAFYKGLGL